MFSTTDLTCGVESERDPGGGPADGAVGHSLHWGAFAVPFSSRATASGQWRHRGTNTCASGRSVPLPSSAGKVAPLSRQSFAAGCCVPGPADGTVGHSLRWDASAVPSSSGATASGQWGHRGTNTCASGRSIPLPSSAGMVVPPSWRSFAAGRCVPGRATAKAASGILRCDTRGFERAGPAPS